MRSSRSARSLVEKIDREHRERREPRDQLRDLLQQFVEVEHRGDFAAESEERREKARRPQWFLAGGQRHVVRRCIDGRRQVCPDMSDDEFID